MKAFTIGAGRLWSLAYAPDGESLVAQEGGADGRHTALAPVRAVRWWDWQAGKQGRVWRVAGPAAFSPDHRLVALSVSAHSRLWPGPEADPPTPGTPAEPGLFDGRTLRPVRGVAVESGWVEFGFAPDCSGLIQVMYWTDQAAMIDRADLPEKYHAEPAARPQGAAPVAFSPGGDWFAVAEGGAVILTPAGFEPEIPGAMPEGAEMLVLGEDRGARRVLYLDEGTLLVLDGPGERRVAHPNGPARASLWDARSRREVPRDFAHAGCVMDAALSADGRLAVTGSLDGTVRLWDVKAWSPLATYRWDIGEVSAVAFSPDGHTCAAGGEGGRVVVWDVEP